jgi:hypothetical protein
MTKITVLDSIMGSGKSTYVINMLNDAWLADMAKGFNDPDHKNRKFLVVVPLLDEVDRFKSACPDLRFKDPQPVHARKLYHLDLLIEAGENIVTTHALFKMLTRDIYKKLLEQGYTLVIDEVLDCVDLFSELKEKDKNLLFSHKMVFVNETTKRLCWNHIDYPDYRGRFEDIKALCDTGSLVCIENKVLIWEFPSEFLRCFDEVIVCTYLFQGSPFYAYLLSEGFHIEMKTIVNEGVYDWDGGQTDIDEREYLRSLIKVYEGPMNRIGDEKPRSHPLSSGWFDRAKEEDLRKLRSSTVNFFERHAKTPSSCNGWTCFGKRKKAVSGKGYARGWIPNNAKATNAFRHKQSMAYLCNWFYHPVIKQYFRSKGIKVNEDLYALSAMIQWIWRSQIRDGKPINVFIPSERMRSLFQRWLAGEPVETIQDPIGLVKAA